MIIILMYICVCNAISERQVREAVSRGALSLQDLQAELGVATCCGQCAQTAQDYLPGGCESVEVRRPGVPASDPVLVEPVLLPGSGARRVA